MKYTLRQLEVFFHTARSGSVSKAANTLAMSQSAASGALQDLEQRYQTQLFDRAGKRLLLNAQGRTLLPLAASILEQAVEADGLLSQRELRGELHIGATLTIGNYVAIPILTRFRQDFPDLRARLRVANTVTIAREVLGFKLDLGLVEGEYTHEELEVIPWRSDELVIFCAPSHPLAAGRALRDDDVVSAEWVLRERGSGTRQTFDRAMHGLQNRLKIFLELDHTEAIKQAVATGAGLGCLSRLALEDDIKSGRFVALAAPGRDMHRNFNFILHVQKHRGAALLRWLEYCEAG